MRLILLDAHLLLLLVVGVTAREYITRHRRLSSYTEDDFDLLLETLMGFDKLAATPNVLTEASNLLGYVGEPIRSELFMTFRNLIATWNETFVSSPKASERPEFIRLGLADSSLLECCDTRVMLLTSDLQLYVAASANEYAATNFNHLRESRGLL